MTQNGVVAGIAGVTDRTTAEGLKGVQLHVARERLPPPADGEFYHADLVGLAAVDAGGATIGTVVAVRNYGAGDLLEIALSGRRETELVPFTAGLRAGGQHQRWSRRRADAGTPGPVGRARRQ